MKKLALFAGILLVILAGILPASAELTKLVIQDNPIRGQITWEETAEFELEITNPLLLTEEVYIVSPISDWSISLSDTRIVVPYKQSRAVTVSLTPPASIRPGKYISCFVFKGLDHPAVSNNQCIFVTVTAGAPLEGPEGVSGEAAHADVETKEEVLDKFMSSTHIITIQNKGNAAAEGEHGVHFELLESFFVASTPLSTGIRSEDGGKEFYWEYSLQPGEELVITYTTSYITLIFSIAIVIVALIFLLSFYMSGLRIDKQLLIPATRHHAAGAKAIKVKLSVKNDTSKAAKNITVEDYIPVPLTLVSGEFGTLEPSAIKQLTDKTKLIWKLPELSPREERLLTYSFKSKLEVLGKILLPRAKLTCVKGGKSSVAYSGMVVIRGKKETRID